MKGMFDECVEVLTPPKSVLRVAHVLVRHDGTETVVETKDVIVDSNPITVWMAIHTLETWYKR